ncbi:hypothetical protein CAPTEDRAFT_193232 [Capitella teleta]|uniref:Fibronectin type-III domain-containing protein n=1 Tax=Capitella teleta TaxID=283909 RepID=R7UGW3_CAPTE|nr:hypothetical protein CAPTEDRAFT_193232 [Capitella teleta]|eukprot:ELU05784.1 hypothetical protein CAPTEDRAFT_193232 [Capitella teleta]
MSLLSIQADGTFPSATKSLQDGGNLTIINLGKEDHGTYECVAKNLVTSVVTTALLIIELTTPHAPYNVTVQTTQTTAKISWLPGYDGGYAQHYVLWYKIDRPGSNEVWRTLRVIPLDTNSFTLYNLHRDTTYQFTVLSRNKEGDGYFSDIISARTRGFDSSNDDTNIGGYPYPPEKPQGRGGGPSPPYNLSVSPAGEGSLEALVLSWKKPTYSEVPITSYVIQYRTVGPWVPLATGISSSSTSYKWSAASHGVTYFFRMFSYSNSTHSNASSAVSYRAKDPLAEGVSITEGMIGGIVGGLLFLLVTVILAIVAVKIFNKRKQREKAMRYGNVKYFGPKQVEANKNSLRITEGDLTSPQLYY